MSSDRIVIVGAGIAGLTAAIDLAVQGFPVTLLERAGTPGGKMREVSAGGPPTDSGLTGFTMRWVFDELCEQAATSLEDLVTLRKVTTLARHAWGQGDRLDLHADPERTAAGIAAFSGSRDARNFEAFCARAREIYDTLEDPFLRTAHASPSGIARHHGLAGLGRLWRVAPFTSLWSALGEFFQDPRLRQLFARYATYAGSSPFAAPATLMLIAHVEQAGVWTIEGGMQRLADAMAALAEARGAQIRYGAQVRDIEVREGRIRHVLLDTGELIEAAAVIVTADPQAVAGGLFGKSVTGAVPPIARKDRSLSAMTWAIHGKAAGFPLCRHTVFFSDRYRNEFERIEAGAMPTEPTVTVCAQDRGDADDPAPEGPERLFCHVNAPPHGDVRRFDQKEIDSCAQRMTRLFARSGLRIEPSHPPQVTTPAQYHKLYPGTGGALYGPACHGWRAAFQRPTARTAIRGLYLAGGGTHPGAGVAMAALSGRLAASCLEEDHVSTRRLHPVAMPGGTSMR